MKLDLFETHDRYQHFTKQGFDISECSQNLINQRPFGEHSFYIFTHQRTLGLDEKLKLYSSGKYINFAEVPEKTLIWQPRLTKPKAQTNSMLFKAYPGTDIIKVIWMIPDRVLWDQYNKGLVTENQTIVDSIHDFQFNREKMERRDDDDLSDTEIYAIYTDISLEAKRQKMMKESNKVISLNFKPESLVES